MYFLIHDYCCRVPEIDKFYAIFCNLTRHIVTPYLYVQHVVLLVGCSNAILQSQMKLIDFAMWI